MSGSLNQLSPEIGYENFELGTKFLSCNLHIYNVVITLIKRRLLISIQVIKVVRSNYLFIHLALPAAITWSREITAGIINISPSNQNYLFWSSENKTLPIAEQYFFDFQISVDFLRRYESHSCKKTQSLQKIWSGSEMKPVVVYTLNPA